MTSFKTSLSPLMLGLMVSVALPAYAQESTDASTDAAADPVFEEVVSETVEAAEEVADVTEVAVEEVEAAADDAPTLEEIAASDDNLEMRDDEEGEPDTMVMLSDVLFGFGDATLQPEAIATLSSIAPSLAELGAFTLNGHTDSVGDEAFNVALGERRAAAVRDWLVSEGGLSADGITVNGVGEADPIVPNRAEDGTDLPENRAQNRRVEFVVPDEG
ncbi:OmpA family protein [Pontivivens insulae]|uniref:Photosystem I P700 chlorophyll a apoprotein A2 n=1 Tax=Pontivivens insulae TaxID=1639689 RepID=A0A2R8AA11_9RHOB|nr:OmpA family protein [Pontivivens insulae]RED12961.1 OmpA family protein [Pontivivens insulae]SPF29054.1 Photosystem I P700 chlorophyll a apoprotein A2 [Pontivivens insulae]